MLSLLQRADAELEANTEKGDFWSWQFSPDELVSELHHHADKLLTAYNTDDKCRVSEHLADIFNYVRRAWGDIHDKPKEPDNDQ